MDEDPRLAYSPYARWSLWLTYGVCLVVPALLLGQTMLAAVSGRPLPDWSWRHNGGVLALWMPLALAFLWEFAKPHRVRIDQLGLHVSGFRTQRLVRWESITRIQAGPQRIILASASDRVAVPTALFRDPAAAIAYVSEHAPKWAIWTIPRSWRRADAKQAHADGGRFDSKER